MNPTRPVASSPAVAARMRRQPRRDTAPELALRRLLHAMGLRYRVAYPVPEMRRRTIDIAFTRARVAVFVDGCFWHGCPDHATWPSANSTWWRDKIEANRRRDNNTREVLEDAGWLVLRFWEHDDLALAATVVQQAVRRSGGVRRAPSDRVDPPPAT